MRVDPLTSDSECKLIAINCNKCIFISSVIGCATFFKFNEKKFAFVEPDEVIKKTSSAGSATLGDTS